MSSISLLLILVCLAAASASCDFGKKEKPKIHIIRVNSNKEMLKDEPDIVEIHLPSKMSNRRRRELKIEETSLKCLDNKDCPLNNTCDGKLKKCISGKRKVFRST